MRPDWLTFEDQDGGTIHGFPVGHEASTTGWQQWISGRAAPAVRPDGELTFDPDSSANSPTC